MNDGAVQVDTGPVALDRRPSSRAIAMIACAGLVAALAVGSSRPELLAFAAPLIGFVAAPLRTARTEITVVAAREAPGRADVVRCAEGEPVVIHLSAVVTAGRAFIRCRPLPVPGLTIVAADSGGVPGTERDVDAVYSGGAPEIRGEGAGPGAAMYSGGAPEVRGDGAGPGASIAVTVTADRWGRYPLPVEVVAIGEAGLTRGVAVRYPVVLQVFPVTGGPGPDMIDNPSLARIGSQCSTRPGAGMEFADIRPFVPGDRIRAVNWRVSARRGSVFVTDRYGELARDVVVLVDEGGDPGPPARDRVVRGAVEIAQAALRSGDRVGIVCLGRAPRWLAVSSDRRQFTGLVATLLDPGERAAVPFDGTVPPRWSVPPGATVVALTALLDSGVVSALLDLRRRGHRVVAVDVLEHPFRTPAEPLVRRLWSLERTGVHRDLGAVGVEVVAWPPETALADALRATGSRR